MAEGATPRGVRWWHSAAAPALVIAASLAFGTPASVASSEPKTATPNAAAAQARRAATGAAVIVGAVQHVAANVSAAQTASTSAHTQPTGSPAPPPASRHRSSPRAGGSHVAVTGWLGDGATFPKRVVVLSTPSGAPLTATSKVHVTENGGPVSGATLTPMTQARPGDFGVIFAVDQNRSMSGATLRAVMKAIAAFASQRQADQELGLVGFDKVPSPILHLTSNASSISTVLGTSLWSGLGANVPAADTLALGQLKRAKLAVGAIVVISDGVGTLTPRGGPTPASVQAAAALAHVPIFTIGIRDAAATQSSFGALRAASPGEFVSSSVSALGGVLREISSSLARGAVLRYRSQQPPGRTVTVSVRVAGASATVSAHYRAPAATAPPAPRRHTPASKASTAPNLAHARPLSHRPSFAYGNGSAPPPRPTSYWTSSASIPVMAAIAAILLTMSIALILHRPSRRPVRARVGSFIGAAETEDGVAIEIKSRRRATPHLFASRRWWTTFVEDVEIGRNPHTPLYLVRRAALFAIIVAVVVGVVSGSVLLVLVPLLLWPIPLRMLISRGARKQRERFADALPGYLQDLASAMRVGRSFVASLTVVAADADEPVRSELERALADEVLGRPIDEGLTAVARRMECPDIDQVALIASLNRRSGSNVAEALDRVADGSRDRADLRREIRGLTAQSKMSSYVLTALPPLLAVAIAVVSPKYAWPLLHTTLGIVLLVVAGLMVLGGWKVMKKITMIKA